jgi:hypothetical protein
MAKGKSVGEFSFKFTTLINIPGPAGSVMNQFAWEGTATGFGTVFSTTTSVGGPKDGTFSECASAFLENGEGYSAIGQGTYESNGKNRWRTIDHIQLSDGRRITSEGEVDLASRSWKGTMFEDK